MNLARFLTLTLQIGLASAMKEVWAFAKHIPCFFHFAKLMTTKTEEYLGKGNEDIAQTLAERMKEATLKPVESVIDFVTRVEKEVCKEYPELATKIRAFFTYFHRKYVC